jgi:two-component system LytT family response regulator
MSTLRALLVDDEPLARAELRALLRAHPEIEVAGEAESVAGAEGLCGVYGPDVVFLDVQLVEKTGFDLLDRLPEEVHVVFVTAYDEYAVRAFEVNALDYLLKPVRRQRLAETVERLLRRGAEPAAPAPVALSPDDHLFLPLRGGHRFVRVAGITCLLATSNYVRICLATGESTLVRRPLRVWEERLPPRLFLRVHRSAIVNLDHVAAAEDAGDGTYRLRVSGWPEPLQMSRRQATRLRDRYE